MTTRRVHKFPTEENKYVLIGVSSRGPKPLDVDLAGTESENPYASSITQDHLGKLKANADDISDELWQATLFWVLLSQRPSKQYQERVERVKVLASVDSGQEIVLTFRENIEGLTQRLGSIHLKADENQVVDLFEWGGILSEASTSAENKAVELQAKYNAQKETVEKLNAQMHDFIQAKKQHEDEILEKCRQFLNTKKLKIRDQQRLLAGAKVDQHSAHQVRKARKGTASSDGMSTRQSKRKADEQKRSMGTEDVEMDDRDGAPTETESENDFELAKSPHRSSSDEPDDQQSAAAGGNEASVADPDNGKVQSSQRSATTRELPIMSSNASTVTEAAKARSTQPDDDDEETDEEL